MKKQMIKRADGSYSQRGLWDNIRANRGSGKKPTAQMLKQERKIKANMAEGGIHNPGFKALPGYVQAKIRANMQTGGMMPQSAAGQSVLQEAMMMSKMQDGGKMPADIARARFMAAANGNVSKAKETASKYGYKMQSGALNLNSVQMNSGSPGFDFAKASSVATAPKEEVSTDIERMEPIDIRKKRTFWDKVKGNIRKAGRSIGFGSPIPKTQFQEGLSSITQEINAKDAERAAIAKNANRNYLQKIGDEFPTYLSLTSDRNVLTDIADIGSMTAQGLGMNNLSNTLQQGKEAIQSFGDTRVAAVTDMINPYSIAANLAGGTIGTAGDLAAGEGGNAASRAATTGTLLVTKGAAGNLAKGITSPVGTGASRIVGQRLGQNIGHQSAHAGQHTLLSPLLVHKKGGTIQDMYYMKKGGQFPDRYKKMGFSGVDKPKRTTSGPKSHAVVTKVNGNYKLIRFGQQGEVGSPDGSARNKAFKARHAKNIAKGKSSAAYWANKVKW